MKYTSGAIQCVCNVDIITGISTTTLSSKGTMIYAQVAQMFYVYLKKYKRTRNTIFVILVLF